MAPHLVCAVDTKERLRDHDAQGLPQVSRCLCPWSSTFSLATAKGLLLASAYQFWILVVLLSRRYAFLVYTSKAAGASLKSRVELGWSGNTWRNVYACLKIGHPPIRSFNWETHKPITPCSRTKPYQHERDRSIAAGHCRSHFFHHCWTHQQSLIGPGEVQRRSQSFGWVNSYGTSWDHMDHPVHRVMGEPTAIRLWAAKLRCQQRDIGISFFIKTPPYFNFHWGL